MMAASPVSQPSDVSPKVHWDVHLSDLPPAVLPTPLKAPQALLSGIEEDLKNEVVVLGQLDADAVRAREEALQVAANYDAELRAQYTALLAEERHMREEAARRHLHSLRRRYLSYLTNLAHVIREREQRTQTRIQRQYLRAEDWLFHKVHRDHGLLDKERDTDIGDRWEAKWAHAPRPIVVKIKAIRGVKDKLPEGCYVLLVAVHDRLGGIPLTYSPTCGVQCKAATPPLLYSGKWFHVELPVDAKLRLVVPPHREVASHLVLQFELWRLKKGKYTPVDKIVAWGAHPIVNKDFSLVSGSFKTGLLKGGPDPFVDRYSRFQKIYEEKPQFWLGNLYFEVWMDLPAVPQGSELAMDSTSIGNPHGTLGAGDPYGSRMNEDTTEGLDRTGSSSTSLAEEFDNGHDIQSLDCKQDIETGEMEDIDQSQLRSERRKKHRRRRDTEPEFAELAHWQAQLRDAELRWANEDEEEDILAERRQRRRERLEGKAFQEEMERRGQRQIKGYPSDEEELERRQRWERQQERVKHHADEEEAGFEREKRRRLRERVRWKEEVDQHIAELEAALQRRHAMRKKGSQASLRSECQADVLEIHPPSRGPSISGHSDDPLAPEAITMKLLSTPLTIPYRPKHIFSAAVSKSLIKPAVDHHRPSTAVSKAKSRANSIVSQQRPEGGSNGNEHPLDAAWAAFQEWEVQQCQGNGRSQSVAVSGELAEENAPTSVVLTDEEEEGQRGMRHVAAASMAHQMSVCPRRHFLQSQKRFHDRFHIMKAILLYDTGILGHWRLHPWRLACAVILFCLAMWARAFTHVFGTWVWLKAHDYQMLLEVWQPLWAEVRWGASSYYPTTEVIAVIAGCFTNGLVFFVAALTSWLSQLAFGGFPAMLSRFILWYGVVILLDPLIVLLADACRDNLDHGEVFALYHFFKEHEGNPYFGVLVTAVSYSLVQGAIAIMAYYWFVHLHLSGRIHDTCNRLLLPETSFFLPNDLEVSKAELADIIQCAKKWRSEAGDMRKVYVMPVADRKRDLFRERLWCLLAVGPPSTRAEYTPPSDLSWIRVYLESITLRVRHRVKDSQRRLGTFTLGEDILDDLRNRHPYLLHEGADNHFTDADQDALYWDTNIFKEEQLTAVRDEEHKEFVSLLALWLEGRCTQHRTSTSQGANTALIRRRPCYWVVESPEDEAGGGRQEAENCANSDEDSAPLLEQSDELRVTDWQLLADFLFFETNGPKHRLMNLKKMLVQNGIDLAFWNSATREESRLDSYFIRLPNFVSQDKNRSIEGPEVSAAMVTVNVVRSRTGLLEPYRRFVVCPNGSIMEPLHHGLGPLDSSDSDDTEMKRRARKQRKSVKAQFTVDDCEYWVYKFGGTPSAPAGDASPSTPHRAPSATSSSHKFTSLRRAPSVASSLKSISRRR